MLTILMSMPEIQKILNSRIGIYITDNLCKIEYKYCRYAHYLYDCAREMLYLKTDLPEDRIQVDIYSTDRYVKY
jgi:hypothetical protein